MKRTTRARAVHMCSLLGKGRTVAGCSKDLARTTTSNNFSTGFLTGKGSGKDSSKSTRSGKGCIWGGHR